MKALFTIIFLVCSFPAFAQGIRVITHESNPYTSLTKAQLRDFFMKKSKHWPNGTPVKFFDRTDGSAERAVFLREIIHKSQREVETFWIGQKLYSGHSAPTQLATDSMTASMISRFPGAIGYVSEGHEAGKGTKFVELIGD